MRKEELRREIYISGSMNRKEKRSEGNKSRDILDMIEDDKLDDR